MKARAAFGAMAMCGAVLGIAVGGGRLISSAQAEESISDKLNSWFFGPPAKQDPKPDDPAELECPSVDVRAGASTMSVSTPGAEAGPMTTRYQATIGQTARECNVVGGMLTIKVGVQGRILLGPAGGPGQLDVPLRLAVVREGTTPKTIWTKFYKITVPIPVGQPTVPFVHIDPDVTFPLPSPSELEAYVVYVGFDPNGLSVKPEPRKKAKKK